MLGTMQEGAAVIKDIMKRTSRAITKTSVVGVSNESLKASERLGRLKEELTSYGFERYKASSVPDKWDIPDEYDKDEVKEVYKELINNRGVKAESISTFNTFREAAGERGLLRTKKEKLKIQINRLESRMDKYYFNEKKPARAEKKIGIIQNKLNKLYKEMAILTESHIKCSTNYHAIVVQRMLKGSDIDAKVKGNKVFFPKSAEPKVIATLQKLQGITPMIYQESIRVWYKEDQYVLPHKKEPAPKEVWERITRTLKKLHPEKSDKSIASATGLIWYKWMPKNGIDADELTDNLIQKASIDIGLKNWRPVLEKLYEQISPADEVKNVNKPNNPGIPKLRIDSEELPAGDSYQPYLEGVLTPQKDADIVINNISDDTTLGIARQRPRPEQGSQQLHEGHPR